MKVFSDGSAMRTWSRQLRAAGKSIGFVPTMGALHEGHLSLMRAAARENDAAAASIFVNPTQFAPHEDLDRYPRMLDRDLELAESAGIQAVFTPAPQTMYPPDFSTWITVEGVSQGLCGASRPHFFRGVATVVAKLFHIVDPDRAYFGRKDAQQCAVIRRMVRDLDMPIEITEMPIVREPDGLAMSSRNLYLTPEERKRALCLSRALFAALDRMRAGERNAATLIELVRQEMSEVDIDYVSLVDADTMESVENIDRRVLLAVAANLPSARLIDNVIFDPDNPGDREP